MATRTRRRIDINTATAEEIERACGIDGVLAQRVVRYRQEHSPFSTREDLDEVPGFAEIRTDEVLSVVDLPSRRSSKRTTRTSASDSRASETRRGRADSPGNRSSSHGEPSRASRSRASRSAEPTTDHAFIRRWVEERGGWPACVRGTGARGGIGMIRIDFPGFSGEDSLERIDWDTWFKQFDDNELALLYREMRHSDGQLDRFNKLVSRQSGSSRSRTRR